MRLLPLLLLSGGCAHVQATKAQDCVTQCGLHMFTNKCEEFRAFEQKAIKAYKKDVPLWSGDLCHMLNEWEVVIHESDTTDRVLCGLRSWMMHLGKESLCVVGYTHTLGKLIEIESDDFANSSLAHEFGHVFQDAFGDLGHCEWLKLGVIRAIREATDGNDIWLPGKDRENGCRK